MTLLQAFIDMRDIAQTAEREAARLREEVAALRLTLGGRTFSATTPEPIGCPMPGACAQVAEIDRLRHELAERLDEIDDLRRHLGLSLGAL